MICCERLRGDVDGSDSIDVADLTIDNLICLTNSTIIIYYFDAGLKGFIFSDNVDCTVYDGRIVIMALYLLSQM